MKKAVDEMKTGINPNELKKYETLFDKLDEMYQRNEMLLKTEDQLHKVFSYMKYRTKYIYSDCRNRMKALNDQITTIVEKITFCENQLGPIDEETDVYLNKYAQPNPMFPQSVFQSMSSHSGSSSDSKDEMKTVSQSKINKNTPSSCESNSNDDDEYTDDSEVEEENSVDTGYQDQDDSYECCSDAEDEEENSPVMSPIEQSSIGIMQMMNSYCSALMQQVIPRGSLKSQKFKTQPCTYFMKYGYCRKENNCSFSHDANFIKAYYQNLNNTKLKPIEALFRTKPCRYFFENGVCTKGAHCNFSHDPSLIDEYHKLFPKKK